jgi:hypothetical protein
MSGVFPLFHAWEDADLNGRRARERRRGQPPPLTERARQLVEEAREERNGAVVAATREFYATIYAADEKLRAERKRATKQMHDRIAAIEQGDRSGILVAQRIDA